MKHKDVVLFDMDGTLVDYVGDLLKSLNHLASPGEHKLTFRDIDDDCEEYLRRRAALIKSDENWWVNLEKLQLGFDIWSLVDQFNVRKMILTQGPRLNPAAWSGKKKWIEKNLGPDVDITITRDKGLVYGKILVDDWPEYIERWLQWRPRGLAIMPRSEYNVGFIHPQVICYDGTNLKEVYKRVESVLSNGEKDE